MSRSTLSARRINADSDASYLVGKESNSTVAVVTRDNDGLHCMRCSGSTASTCAHVVAVVRFEKPATATTVSIHSGLAELIEQAAREHDGNFFSGVGVAVLGGVVRLTMQNGDTFALAARAVPSANVGGSR